MHRVTFLLSAVAAVPFVVSLPAAERPRTESIKQSSAAPLIRVSPETTHLVAPVDAEGYVDFLAALNAHYGKGVSPSENAAIPLLEALGDADHPSNTMNMVRQSLGMSPLGDTSRALVSAAKYARTAGVSEEDFQKQLNVALDRPWTKDEFPQLADLLVRNTDALAQVHQAVQRPKYFRPFTKAKPNLSMASVLLPDIQMHREVARMLKSRAMLNIAGGQAEAARQDLYDMHRLARCTAQGMSIIEGLVGIAIESMACYGDNVWANQSGATAAQLAAYRQQLAALPPASNLVDRVDVTERLFLLEVLQMTARGTLSPEESNALIGEPNDSQAQSMVKPAQLVAALSLVSIDWNAAMVESNRFYDDIVVAGRVTDRAERLALYEAWETRLKQEKVRIAGNGGVEGATVAALRFAFGSSKSRAKDVSGVLCTLLLPAVKQATSAEESGRQRLQMAQVALALAEYRAKEGQYPAQLSNLVPQFLAAIPEDVFAGQPLRYDSEGAAYRLYSVGRNGRDDGGITGSPQGADDIVFSDPATP